MPFDLSLDESQEAVADLFGRLLVNECPVEVVRAAAPLGFAPELWRTMAEVGATGMAAAGSAGGGDASMRELVVAAAAVGAAIAPVPFVDHAVVARRHPDASIVDGSCVAALALRPAQDGVWSFVPAGAVADVVVGVDGDRMVAVRSEPPGRCLHNYGDLPLAHRSCRVGVVTELGPASELTRMVAEWKILTAAALGGLAERALAMATAYVKERHQFGRPVGAFQAVQHGLADGVAYVEGTRLLTHKAAWAVDTAQPARRNVDEADIVDPIALAAMAFAFAAEGAAAVTKRALQYHGAYGFSAEYDIQLYYRRARGWPQVLASPSGERQTLSELLWPSGSRPQGERSHGEG